SDAVALESRRTSSLTVSDDDSVGAIFIASRINSAHFVTPRFNSPSNIVANFAGTFKPFLLSSDQRGWVGETPVQSVSYTGKDRTTRRFGFITHGDDVREKLSALKNIKDGLRLVVRDIDSDLVHHLNS